MSLDKWFKKVGPVPDPLVVASADSSSESDSDTDHTDTDGHPSSSICSPAEVQHTQSAANDIPIQEACAPPAKKVRHSGHTATIALTGQIVTDIASLDLVNLTSLADSAKEEILTSCFQPPIGWKGPLRKCGLKNRRVPDKFFDRKQFPTLSYSISQDGMYCSPCVLFQNSNTYLVRKPLTDWSNATKIISQHFSSKEHQKAVAKAAGFTNVCSGRQDSIRESLSKAYKEKVERNHAALTAIIKTIVVCGRQNLAIRGHDDTSSTFEALLQFRAECDQHLQRHLISAPSNAKYTSHQIQNEIINLCGQQVQDNIVTSCRDSVYFSILVDESADISNTEQVAICLRYARSPNFTIEENFVCFADTSETTGDVLSGIICNKMRDLNLDMSNLVGQGYDGAANMSGHVRGVQARIQEEYPGAVYVHCLSHNLNLAIGHSCTIVSVRNMYNIVQKLTAFITASPKRQQIYVTHAEKYKAPLLTKYCETRWTCRTDSVDSIIECFQPIIDTLESLEGNTDASVHLRSILCYQFIICIFIVRNILKYVKPLTNYLQIKDCDLVRASDQALTIVGIMKEKRNSDTFYCDIWNSAVKLAAKYNIDPMSPRAVGRQAHRSNIPAENPKEYWRLNVFLPFADNLISELQDRLLKPRQRLLVQHLLPKFLNVNEMTAAQHWTDIKIEYSHFLKSTGTELDIELETWQHAIADETFAAGVDTLQAATKVTEHLYPNLHIMFKVLLTMPVSTSTAERAFSSLRRLKTYLRNSMCEERLSGLALMHIHKDIDIDVQKVLQQFDATGHRRIVLLFD